MLVELELLAGLEAQGVGRPADDLAPGAERVEQHLGQAVPVGRHREAPGVVVHLERLFAVVVALLLGVELEAVIDRREYGLEYNATLPKGGFALDNDVQLQVSLELVREA